MEGEELARARLAFRGSLELARGWRAFSSNPKHHDLTYWSMLSSLFAEPGMNRSALVERIVTFAGVSRSTAERAIREGRDEGYLVDQPAGKEVLYYLSPRLTEHCVAYFRNYMDQAKLMQHLGYDRG